MSKLYVNDSVTAPTFIGKLQGNADTATKATQDSDAQQINTTYIKGLSVNGKAITYTKGNGNTGTITTQDTTYSNFVKSGSGAKAGLVPAPSTTAGTTKYLREDGTWTVPPDNNTTYSTGTTSTSGLTKLYTSSGTATDGTMTQAAIKSALDGKAASDHKQAYTASECTTYNSDNNTIGVTPAAVKKAIGLFDPKEHTHNYAGSSSAGGVANSAAKLSTARTISVNNDDYVMSFSFDGSANVSTKLHAYSAIVSQGNANNYPYHRFAKLDATTGNWQDIVSTFLITQDYQGGGFGICQVALRTNNQSNKEISSVEIRWLERTNLAANLIQAGLYYKDGSTYADLFFKTSGTYCGTVIRNLGSGSRGGINRTWTLIDSAEANNTTSSDKLTSIEVYSSVSSAATSLHNQAYTEIVTGSDVGMQWNVTFYASGWTAASDGTYTQSVNVSSITAKDTPMLTKNLSYSTSAADRKKYNKAFGILCSGSGETQDGKINWKIDKKPEIDITVTLMQVI